MITYMQNSHLRDRRAVVEINPTLIAECVPVLVDAGFKIVGSATSRGLPIEVVRLIIEGDALPAECDGAHGLLLVSLTVQQEQYGRQRITRVKDVALVRGAEAVTA
ncbi:hypothetical protein [Bradyrhizobium sp. WSM1417]|uniref:hypothetical protein n=1 Tax=Bradyrhizobium sp. WSM1417 TaxID=754500 RepID=UPI000484E2F6|nr:hypothetical protein [Bradyrhizobium sp. WSM1417]